MAASRPIVGINLALARGRLSNLVATIDDQQRVDIMVRGKVRACLVSLEYLRDLEAAGRRRKHRRLRGSMRLLGDLEPARNEIRRQAGRMLLASSRQLLGDD